MPNTSKLMQFFFNIKNIKVLCSPAIKSEKNNNSKYMKCTKELPYKMYKIIYSYIYRERFIYIYLYKTMYFKARCPPHVGIEIGEELDEIHPPLEFCSLAEIE